MIAGTLVANCAAPTQAPTDTPSQGAVAPTATPTQPTEVPTATPADTPTSTPPATDTPQPTDTPTPRPTPTATLGPEDIQIYIGIPPEAILRQPPYSRCGGFGIWTLDHDPGPGALDYWEAHPEIAEPDDWTHRTRDGRRSPDYCTDVGYRITFLQTQGIVEGARPNDGVMTVLTTEGTGTGLLLVFGHVDMDVDRDTPGMQHLTVGSVVRQGDVIAYTGRAGIPPEVDPSTNFGIIIPNMGYHPDQEMMLFGPDGQPNILR